MFGPKAVDTIRRVCELLFDSDITAAEIVEDLQAALAQFAAIASDLKP